MPDLVQVSTYVYFGVIVFSICLILWVLLFGHRRMVRPLTDFDINLFKLHKQSYCPECGEKLQITNNFAPRHSTLTGKIEAYLYSLHCPRNHKLSKTEFLTEREQLWLTVSLTPEQHQELQDHLAAVRVQQNRK